MKCFRGEVDTFVARDMDHLKELLIRHYGDVDAEDMLKDGWTELPPDRMLKIRMDDCDGPIETRTVQEWISLNGPGMLCSTVW